MEVKVENTKKVPEVTLRKLLASDYTDLFKELYKVWQSNPDENGIFVLEMFLNKIRETRDHKLFKKNIRWLKSIKSDDTQKLNLIGKMYEFMGKNKLAFK